jgi:hypothetical protein
VQSVLPEQHELHSFLTITPTSGHIDAADSVAGDSADAKAQL